MSAIRPACMHACNCVVVEADMKTAKGATRMGAVRVKASHLYLDATLLYIVLIFHCRLEGLNSISSLSCCSHVASYCSPYCRYSGP